MNKIRLWKEILQAVLIGSLLIHGALAENSADMPLLEPDPTIAEMESSSLNETALASYQDTPAPVTIFQAGVQESSLPGPRYMAFGPSTIGISLHPMLFSLLIVLGIAALAFLVVRSRGRGGKSEKE